MNVLERALVEKAGRENGWENVIESADARVVLASARHRGRATILAMDPAPGWHVEFPEARLARELERTLPGLMQGGGRFDASDMDTLAALLRRAANEHELAAALSVGEITEVCDGKN